MNMYEAVLQGVRVRSGTMIARAENAVRDAQAQLELQRQWSRFVSEVQYDGARHLFTHPLGYSATADLDLKAVYALWQMHQERTEIGTGVRVLSVRAGDSDA
jgi:hypothetical protein